MGFQADAVSERALSLDEVEEALIACHELWRRSPGGGRWPFASDGPWHLLVRSREDGDWTDTEESLIETGGKLVSIKVTRTPKPKGPLEAVEVAERDRVTAWLMLLSDPLDRVLVHQATYALHRGESHVPWKRLKPMLRWDKGLDALAWRYKRALAGVAGALNGWTERRVKAEAAAWVRGSGG